MRERLVGWATSLSAKYMVLFVLLVSVPAVGLSTYLLHSSYQDNKRALTRLQQEKAKSLAFTVEEILDEQVARLQSIHGQGLSRAKLDLVLRPLLLSGNVRGVFYLDPKRRMAPTSVGS